MKIIWIFMCVFSTLGILSQIWIVNIMQRARQGSPLTRQIDLKYATCVKLDVQINNIPAFVGKIMNNYRVFGLPLRIIASFADVCGYACVLLGLWGMYVVKMQVSQMVTVAGLGIACFCMLRVVAIMVDAKSGLEKLKFEIVDSLENYSRGIQMQDMPKEPVAKKRFSKEAESEFNKLNKNFDKIMKQNKDKVIMEVLDEYL